MQNHVVNRRRGGAREIPGNRRCPRAVAGLPEYCCEPLDSRRLLAVVSVTTTTDALDGNTSSIANLLATPGGGSISLREAIVASNNTPGADTITVPAGIYTLTRTGNDANATNGDLDINDSVTINGAGSGATFIQGASAYNPGTGSYTGSIGDKVIGINQDGTHTGLTVNISNVTIRWGQNTIASGDPTFAYTGGGVDIFLSGTTGNNISLNNCIITENTNVNSYGGGINIDSGFSGIGGDTVTNVFRGTVTLSGCTISNNRTLSTVNEASGGGINLFADKHDVNITNCTITGNRTTRDTANGGGINIRHSFGGTITISSTSITSNTAGGAGGGMLISFTQNVSMTGGSISGNTSLASGSGGSAWGGGINAGAQAGTTTSFNGVTISNNIATGGANGIGGGISSSSAGSLSFTNCTVFGNSADTGGGVYSSSGSVTLSGCSITGNSAANGGAVAGSGGTLNITSATITGNTATSSGGAANLTGATLSMSGSRIVSNSAGSAIGITRTSGTATVTNNWWGTHNPAGIMSGTVTFTPWIQLRVIASAASILVSSGGTSSVTADLTTNSANASGFGVPNPTSLNVAFAGVKGSVSPGNVNLNASSAASTTWTVGAVSGAGSASATVDGYTVSAAISVVPLTPTAPDLQAASDSGTFSNDNVTNAADPVFDASAVEAAATVALLRNGTSVASRTGPGPLADVAAPAGTQVYTIRQTVEGIASSASTGLSVTIDRTTPAVPNAPDLQSGSDSGTSNTDNTTNSVAPIFDLSGSIEANASVQLLRGATIAATRTGAGAAQDPGPLSTNSYAYTARQVDLAGNIGTASSSLTVVVDTIAPQLSALPSFSFLSNQAVNYAFSENVQPSLTVSDIAVDDLTTPATIADASKLLNYVPGTNTATLSFTGFPATLLADRNYRATLSAAGVTDVAGNPLIATNVLNFFVLGGDANRDRKVDTLDFNLLAGNFGGSGKVFSQGDFNYSGGVDSADFNILTAKYGLSLPAPVPAGAVGSVPSLFGSIGVDDTDEGTSVVLM